MGYKILRFITYISLIFFPYTLVKQIICLYDIFLSLRFSIYIKSKCKLFLKSPFYILGYKYIKFGENFSAGPRFRI